MNKRRWLVFSIITAIMVVAGVVGVSAAYYSDTETSSSNVVRTINNWYNLAWHWRKPIVISNGGLVALTDFQLRLTVDTASLVTAGKMLASGNDIRFSASNGMTDLKYWIESGMNTASTVIWVKVASIPVGSSTIYMYYGNTAAAAASNGSSTFLLFDDFESYTVGSEITTWIETTAASGTRTTVDSTTISGIPQGSKAMRIDDTGASATYGVYGTFSSASNLFIVEYYAAVAQTDERWEMEVRNGATQDVRLVFYSDGYIKKYDGTTNTFVDFTSPITYGVNTWYEFKLDKITTSGNPDTWDAYINGSPRDSNIVGDNNATTLNRVYLMTLGVVADNGDMYIDLVKVRAYAATAPTYLIEAEE